MSISITRIETAGEDYRLLFCKTPRSRGLRFHAGQQVDLGHTSFEGCRRVPVASCPCDGRFLEFHIQKMEKDPFSDFVFNRLRKGGKLQLRGPFGDDMFQSHGQRPIIFIAHESGFAAINSLIEHAQTLELESNQTLFRFSNAGSGPYRANLCHAWEDAFDHFCYVECQEPVRNEAELRSRCEALPAYLSHPLADADIYMALPDAMSQTLESFFLEQAVLPEHIRKLAV